MRWPPSNGPARPRSWSACPAATLTSIRAQASTPPRPRPWPGSRPTSAEAPGALRRPSGLVGLRSPAGGLGFAPHAYERGAQMYDLHYWPTPNGKKVTILLEELGVPYTIVPMNIGRGDQFTPESLKISPNN